MAKNDFFVIIYQVLKYLYECLKKGEKPEICYLSASMYSIPEQYWSYILVSLIEDGYIKGIRVIETKDGIAFGDLQNTIIAPKGIEFLFENSLIEKAKKSLKDVKEMIPFV